MAYQFTQTGAEIQDILDQVGTNTGDISQNTQDISDIQTAMSASHVTSGSFVNLVGYTQSNQYVAPSDGYAFVYNASNLTGFVAIDGHIGIGGTIGRFSVFVKKGMSMYEDGSVTVARFVPLL